MSADFEAANRQWWWCEGPKPGVQWWGRWLDGAWKEVVGLEPGAGKRRRFPQRALALLTTSAWAFCSSSCTSSKLSNLRQLASNSICRPRLRSRALVLLGPSPFLLLLLLHLNIFQLWTASFDLLPSDTFEEEKHLKFCVTQSVNNIDLGDASASKNQLDDGMKKHSTKRSKR